MKETITLKFDFPRKNYPDLKSLCTKKGITINNLISSLLIKSIEDDIGESWDRFFEKFEENYKKGTYND